MCAFPPRRGGLIGRRIAARDIERSIATVGIIIQWQSAGEYDRDEESHSKRVVRDSRRVKGEHRSVTRCSSSITIETRNSTEERPAWGDPEGGRRAERVSGIRQIKIERLRAEVDARGYYSCSPRPLWTTIFVAQTKIWSNSFGDNVIAK